MIAFLTALISRGATGLRTILGAPDYQRYLSHMKSAHPGDRVMSETEFNHTRLNDRYNRAGSKCC